MTVDSVTETEAVLSWTPVGDSAYLIFYTQPNSPDPDIVKPAGGIVAEGIVKTVRGLYIDQPHKFGVFSAGDGVRYTLESRYSSPLVIHSTAAPIYAEKVTQGPSLLGMGLTTPCAPLERFFGDPVEHTLPDDSIHTLTATIRAGTVAFTAGTATGASMCAAGVIESVSDPGAISLSLRGGLHIGGFTLLSVRIADVDAWAQAIFHGNPGALIQFREENVPSQTATPEVSIPEYTCPSPCEGGKVAKGTVYTTPRYLKNDVFHVYGTHEYSRGGHVWRDETEVSWQPGSPEAGSARAFLGAIMSEVATDIGEQIQQSIRDAVDALLEGGS